MSPTDILQHISSRPLRLPMPADPLSAEVSRILTKRVLCDWDLGHMQENLLIVVSELVTNALKEGEPFWFNLSRMDDTAVVAVSDKALGVPEVKKAEETDTSGRGMFLVEALSEEWGVFTNLDGTKTVWARVAK